MQFDNEKLIAACAHAIETAPPVSKTHVQIRKADLAIGRGGVLTEETSSSAPIVLEAKKSVHEHVVYDSESIEKTFAQDLEKNEAVKVYAKLPGWFKVPTPLGTYNPDWAVLVEQDGAERLYFVVETKGSLFNQDLRGNEHAKILCGKAHFKALATDAPMVVVNDIVSFMAEWQAPESP